MKWDLIVIAILAIGHVQAIDNLGVRRGGMALNIEGTQNYLVTPVLNNFPATSLTLSSWMKYTRPQQFGMLFQYIVNSTVHMSVYNWVETIFEVKEQVVGVQTIVTDGAWSHLAVSWTSSTGRVLFYANGQLVGNTTTVPNLTLPPGGRFHIGYPRFLERFFGQVDEVALFKTALSDAQVAQLYSSPANFWSAIPSSQVFLHYSFDQVNITVSDPFGAQTIQDISGNGVSLTPSSGWTSSLLVPSLAPIANGSLVNSRLNPAGNAAYFWKSPSAPAAAASLSIPASCAAAGLSFSQLSSAAGTARGTAISVNGAAQSLTFNGVWVDAAASWTSLCNVTVVLGAETLSWLLSPNRAPVLWSFSVSVNENDKKSISLYQTYSTDNPGVTGVDADGDAVTVKLVSAPKVGQLVDSSNNSLVFSTPGDVIPPNFVYLATNHVFGVSDAFSFTVVDALGTAAVSAANVSLRIASLSFPPPPLDPDMKLTLNEDTFANLTLSPKFSDDSAQSPLVFISRFPRHGKLFQVNADGSRGAQISEEQNSRVAVSEWASQIVSYSSQYPDASGSWAATQMLGVPNSFPVLDDSIYAWAGYAAGAEEWAHVRFATPMHVDQLEIYETYRPGNIRNVSFLDSDGVWKLLYTTDTPRCFSEAKARIFSPNVCPLPFPVQDIKFHMFGYPDSWVEIDAIRLSGTKGATSQNTVLSRAHKVVYMPDADYHGTDDFAYIINNCVYWSDFRTGNLPTGTVTLSVKSINDAPRPVVVMNGSLLVGRNSITLDAWDDGPVPASQLVFEIVSVPEMGTLLDALSGAAVGPGARLSGASLVWLVSAPCSLSDQKEWAGGFSFRVSDSLLWSTVTSYQATLVCTVYTEAAVSKGLINALRAISSFIIFMLLVSAAATFYFRKHSVIRAASYPFLLLMHFGCILGIIHLFMAHDYPLSKQQCVAQAWIGHLAFWIVFSSLFAKSWRIAKIFNAKKLEKQRLTDRSLVFGVVGIVGVAVLWLILWSAIDGLQPLQVLSGTTQLLQTWCRSRQSFWAYVILAAELAWLLVGVWLAVSTRNIPGDFNESKFIGMVIYNTAFVAGFIIPLLFSVVTEPSIAIVLQCIGAYLIVSGCAVLLFGSRFYLIRYGGAAVGPDPKSAYPSADAALHGTGPSGRSMALQPLSGGKSVMKSTRAGPVTTANTSHQKSGSQQQQQQQQAASGFSSKKDKDSDKDNLQSRGEGEFTALTVPQQQPAAAIVAAESDPFDSLPPPGVPSVVGDSPAE